MVIQVSIHFNFKKVKKEMKSYVFFLLSLAAVLVAADINDVRKAAIKKIDIQIASIKSLSDETSTEVEKREPNIKIISKHIREFGDGIYGKTTFEIRNTAKSFYMMASLLGSSNDVFRCIETQERDGMADTDKTYTQQFLNPGRDYETKAEQYQRNVIKTWKDDYYKAIGEYGDIYKKAISEIQKSNSESYINNVVKQFESTTKQMADIIVSIHPNMAKIHIQVLKVLDQILVQFQQYSRQRVDETTKNLQKCLPKYSEKADLNDELDMVF